MNEKDDFFHLLRRLAHEGVFGFLLSYMALPFVWRRRKADAANQADLSRRREIDKAENESWEKLTEQFPSIGKKN